MRYRFVLLALCGAASLPGPASAAGESRGLRLADLRLFLDGAYDSNIDHESVPTASLGGGGGIEGRVEIDPHPLSAWIEARGAGEAFSRTTRWDRFSHREEAGTALHLGREAEIRNRAQFDTRTSTEDGEIVNQTAYQGELWIQGPGPGLRAFGGLRWRRYSDRPDYDEDIRQAGVELRQRAGTRVALRVGYRYEDTDSRTPERSSFRHRVGGMYSLRFAARGRFEVGLEHQWRRYPLERVESPEGDRDREDRRWVPSAVVAYRLPSNQEVALAYEFQRRTSNDPEEAFEAHRVELSVAWILVR